LPIRQYIQQYTASDKGVIAIDAETGKIKFCVETKSKVFRLLVIDGVCVFAEWDDLTPAAPWVFRPQDGKGRIRAFNALSGEGLWSFDGSAYQIIAAADTVYALIHSGRQSTRTAFDRGYDLKEERIVALELRTGKTRWNKDFSEFAKEPRIELHVAGPNFLGVRTQTKPSQFFVLAATDGRQLWSCPSSVNWTPWVDNKLWVFERGLCDSQTGEISGKIPAPRQGQGCRMAKIVNGCDLLVECPNIGGNACAFRVPCVEGVVPGNGSYYIPQNSCACPPAALDGLIALGSSDPPPEAAEFKAKRSVQQGPAFEKPSPSVTSDWPTYRQDAERSNSFAGDIPTAEMKEKWNAPLSREIPGLLGRVMKERLSSPITSPIVAGPLVVTASRDSGQLFALDGQTGKQVWSAFLGSRIDSPPTYHNGTLIGGCNDGWIYAMRAADGALAWKSRIAPAERRIIVNGRIESLWPAIGCVLVHNNVAYCTAGRSSQCDGGIALVALDASTGETKWCRQIGANALRQNDALCIRDNALAFAYFRFDLENGNILAPKLPLLDFANNRRGEASEPPGDSADDPPKPVTKETYFDPVKIYNFSDTPKYEGRILDALWTVIFNRRAANPFDLGKAFNIPQKRDSGWACKTLAWSDKTVVKFTGAVSRETETQLWKIDFPETHSVNVIALGRETAIYAGRVGLGNGVEGSIKNRKDLPTSGRVSGFIWIVSIDKGEILRRLDLDSPVMLDGVAVSDGRLYVSCENGKLLCFGK
jgi:outer membrane protein assembly factor BamB